jgi:hypothetical protein
VVKESIVNLAALAVGCLNKHVRFEFHSFDRDIYLELGSEDNWGLVHE